MAFSFGSTPSTSTTTTFSFGTTATGTGLQGIGGATQPAAAGLFGQANKPSGFGAAMTSFGSAPGAAPAAQSAFGFGGGGFGQQAANPILGQQANRSAFGTGAFGQTQPTGLSLAGVQPAVAAGVPSQQVASSTAVEQLYNAVLHCSVFGDERDSILARWNMLQAAWGSGKAVYSQTMPPIDLDEQNPLCRFKTIGYSALPSAKAEQGVLSAVIRKKPAELQPLKEQIAAGISSLFGRHGMKTVIESIRPCGGGGGGANASSEVLFHVQENNPQTGQSKKIPSNDVFSFLSQPMNGQNLQRMGIESVSPKVSFTEKQIRDYLETPPKGIDPRLWKQAQMDNPDAKKLIPVPLIGFKALQQRIQCQDQQAKIYQGRLDAIAEEISDLQKRHEDTLAKMRDAKRRHLALSHRVLHVMVKQEVTRKTGFTIQPEEEKLGVQLEALQSEMSAPTQFKGKLNELLSQVRLQSQTAALSGGCSGGGGGGGGEKYQLDGFLLQDVKEVLKLQQNGIQALIQVIKEDLVDLGTVNEAMSAVVTKTTKPF